MLSKLAHAAHAVYARRSDIFIIAGFTLYIPGPAIWGVWNCGEEGYELRKKSIVNNSQVFSTLTACRNGAANHAGFKLGIRPKQFDDVITDGILGYYGIGSSKDIDQRKLFHTLKSVTPARQRRVLSQAFPKIVTMVVDCQRKALMHQNWMESYTNSYKYWRIGWTAPLIDFALSHFMSSPVPIPDLPTGPRNPTPAKGRSDIINLTKKTGGN